ncbi:MAG: alpha-galactosidase [Flavisolibacter sp.]
MKTIPGLILILFFFHSSFGQVAEPTNHPCKITYNRKSGSYQLIYDDVIIARIRPSAGKNVVKKYDKVDIDSVNNAVNQTIKFTGTGLHIKAIVSTSSQAITAETRTPKQELFPMIRTTIGNPSVNQRNNAVYDRYSDWVLEIQTNNGIHQITSSDEKSRKTFFIEAGGNEIEFNFKPLFYQKHKGIAYFKPRSYDVWKQPVTGWSSWWAYFRNFNEKSLDDLLSVWKEKQLADFGYKYIQIDDVYQGGNDAGHNAPKKGPNGYYATGPGTWLQWKKDLFPHGLNGYIRNVNKAGFIPGAWLGCFFTSSDSVKKHPDWFIQDSTGKASIANWVTYAINSKNQEAAETLIRPTFRSWKNAGMKYVKIDQLRHYLYDNMHNNLQFFKDKNYTPDDVFREYLGIARKELGKETFILSCWGVLPQSVGLADACRIGGDGYGPVTMQQYNSWNGIVWINDPDHCDVYPEYKAAEAGNVKNVSATEATLAETRIRPSLASIAGCMLILSDKPDVYKNDENLEGVKRASPVLFSVPGQLYDYDEVKTKLLPGLNLNTIKNGANPTIIDADQYGSVCPWWLNEINRNFENWNVLSHLNWTKEAMPSTEVSFAELGLDNKKEYLVFEFWNKDFLGIHKNRFIAKAMQPNEINTFAIREKTNHPQIISTNRHITQGGYDLLNVLWKQNNLSGISKVVKNDKYELYIYLPKGYTIQSALMENQKMIISIKNNVAVLSYIPSSTGAVNWKVAFAKKSR